MLIATVQYNPIIGDLHTNVERLLKAAAHAKKQGACLVVTPELALTGYPPRDLLDKPAFVHDALQALAYLTRHACMPMLVGTLAGAEGDPLGAENHISNAAVLISEGRLLACHRKMLLPSYDIFDEARYFTPGTRPTVVTLGPTRLGLSVCEDMWKESMACWRAYPQDPLPDEVAMGADLLINLSASPYHRGKAQQRWKVLQSHTQRHHKPVVYVNQVGGHDSVIFDGRSMAVSSTGNLHMRMPAFQEGLAFVRYQGDLLPATIAAEPACWEEEVIDALCLGLRDYLRACGLQQVVLGLSGGIDSSLSCALAVRALGASQVMGVMLPSAYSASSSLEDARALAQALGIRWDVLSIEPLYDAFLNALSAPFAGLPADVTEENLQTRIRGTLLMAYANKKNALLLTTGNKSELSMGYCSLYGDMNGGLGLLSDLYKTDVYALAYFLNTHMPCIPVRSLTKAPSAELRPHQRDQDDLPPYPLLDAILQGYIDKMLSSQDLIAQGYPEDVVYEVVQRVDQNEHKRHQMAPGLRISSKAFGEGRRMPIAHVYKP